jgi:hypothetical protein
VPGLETETEQEEGGRVPAAVVTGGEVQGQERVQELTRVLRNHVSRAGVVGMVELDGDLRRRRRGRR